MRDGIHILCGLLIFLFLAGFAFAQPFGIDQRTSNTTLLIDTLPADTPGSMTLERVFPSLTFTNPTYLTQIDDGSGRFFVLEKAGRILTFPNLADPQPADLSVFLDLSARTRTVSEEGILGLTFDPDYATNGEFYVYYSWNGTSPSTSRVSRFTNDNPADNSVDPATEQILLSVGQPAANHNGGMIEFGPDNLLYIALGDGGSRDDPWNNAQDTTTLFGSILRIDVLTTPDQGLAYHIPEDNPFVEGGPDGDQTRAEIFAYGLRNPWRFSFDAQTGTLFCGDVGQDQIEEIDVIEAGANYGWRRMEGSQCYIPPECTTQGLTLPIAEYTHTVGRSVTGGYVYYGSRLPELFGLYLYADFSTGRFWAFRYENGAVTEGPFVLINQAAVNPSSFGTDLAGEVYVTDFGGGIYQLTPADPPEPGDFPTRLSDIPALLSAGKGQDQTGEGIIPYAPSAKLWSDGTHKSRFIAMPGLTQIGYREAGGWDFPEETILIKNFLLPMDERNPQATLKRIETRLLFRKNGLWHGFSYEWNEDETDATLLADGKFRTFDIITSEGLPLTFDYRIPSRNECLQCHTEAAGGVLGLNTPQMNFDFDYPASGVTDNQLRTYDHINLFESALPAPPDQLPRMPEPQDTSATLHDRARAYLAANCAMCHQPGGPTPTNLDLRWEISDEQMNAIDVEPSAGTLGIQDPAIISTRGPGHSVLLQRMDRRTATQMPPLATSRVDEEGVDVVRQWIESIRVNAARKSGMYE